MEHVWWALEKLSKMRKVKQTSAPPLPFYSFQFSISHCWAFSAFHGCHFVSRAVEKVSPFVLFLTCFSLFFFPRCLFVFQYFFWWVCFGAVWNSLARKSLKVWAQPLRNPLKGALPKIPSAIIEWVGDFWDRVFRLNSDFQLLLVEKQLLAAESPERWVMSFPCSWRSVSRIRGNPPARRRFHRTFPLSMLARSSAGKTIVGSTNIMVMRLMGNVEDILDISIYRKFKRLELLLN